MDGLSDRGSIPLRSTFAEWKMHIVYGRKVCIYTGFSFFEKAHVINAESFMTCAFCHEVYIAKPSRKSIRLRRAVCLPCLGREDPEDLYFA